MDNFQLDIIEKKIVAALDKRFDVLQTRLQQLDERMQELSERIKVLEDSHRYTRQANRFLGATPRLVEQHRSSITSINARDIEIFPSLSQ